MAEKICIVSGSLEDSTEGCLSSFTAEENSLRIEGNINPVSEISEEVSEDSKASVSLSASIPCSSTEQQSEGVGTKSDLLYSEMMNMDRTSHVVGLINKKNRRKPVMKFVPSTVLKKVKELLPRLEQAQKEMEGKPKRVYNIEMIKRGSPYIAMDVGVLHEYDYKPRTDSQSSEESDPEWEIEVQKKRQAYHDVVNEKIMTSYCDLETGIKEDGLQLSILDMLSRKFGKSFARTKSSSSKKLLEASSTESDQLPSKKLCQEPQVSSTESDQPPAKKLCRELLEVSSTESYVSPAKKLCQELLETSSTELDQTPAKILCQEIE